MRSFERKGLDSTAAPMVEALRQRDVVGASLLDVGAGSGTAVVTLLEAGMTKAVAYDISPSYEQVAGALFQARGLQDRVEWHTGDFLAAGDGHSADVVYLNRVVCCYPEVIRLVDSVAGAAGRLLALSYPRRRFVMRTALRVINLLLRLRRVPFRVFAHDPTVIAARVAAAGLREIASGRGAVWEWKVWERSA